MAKRDATTVQIQNRHLTKIDRVAKKMGVSRAAVIRWAIEAYNPSFVLAGSNVSTVKLVSTPEPVEAVA